MGKYIKWIMDLEPSDVILIVAAAAIVVALCLGGSSSGCQCQIRITSEESPRG